jgi:hypothetical protein
MPSSKSELLQISNDGLLVNLTLERKASAERIESCRASS